MATCTWPKSSKNKSEPRSLGGILIRSPESTNVHLRGGCALLGAALQLSFYTTRHASATHACGFASGNYRHHWSHAARPRLRGPATGAGQGFCRPGVTVCAPQAIGIPHSRWPHHTTVHRWAGYLSTARLLFLIAFLWRALTSRGRSRRSQRGFVPRKLSEILG